MKTPRHLLLPVLACLLGTPELAARPLPPEATDTSGRMAATATTVSAMAETGTAETRASSDPRALFAAGTAASREGDFATALEFFIAARDAGMDGAAVHYNIGVSAWELDRLELAREAFLVVARSPEMAALAYYNLGLVSLRRDDPEAARDWFRRAREHSEEETLRELAELQLEGLAPAAATVGRVARRARDPVLVFVAASLGYDDNVALVADGDLLGSSDTPSAFAETSLGLSVPLGGAFSLEAAGFVLRHADASEFDQAGAQAELVYQAALGAWDGEIAAGAGLNWLDGEEYEQRFTMLLGATRRFATDWRLQLQYRFEDIDGSAPFERLSGRRQEAAVALYRRVGAQRLWFEYRLEFNDRDSAALSADRHRLDVEWERELHNRLRVGFGAGWRDSRTEVRVFDLTERRLELAAGLAGPLAGRWEWSLRYDWTRNDAKTPFFDYQRHRVVAGVQGLF
ncbi:tetratricopeptide repeat protein [Wenzhouxiangella sp. XN24]|uniref:tetratricopeptide repeat protein n=1 Tax=Wenzhouxiangella sp. XN24 TaxID=2713569 RepID=UPI0013EE3583|nr:tetratricopeptide repeat protein [Wenzhouxiangella sp. XN24]NGX16966.1 hypothetical protein [Wenzhouxiangella sp. XN24]